MKTYTITVNGNVYDVTVEEGESTASAGTAKAAPKATPKAAPKKAAPKASGSQGSVKVNSPMPGKILNVRAKAGAAVKKGDVILVLEAMKMENDIIAPQDGTIVSVNVSVGDSVEAGVVLATLD